MPKPKIHQAIRFVGVDDDSQDYTWTGEGFWLTLPNGNQIHVFTDGCRNSDAVIVQTWGPGSVEGEPVDECSAYLPAER